jgi:hypothetical protein
MDYSKICFVIMPFGEKAVGDRTVNFDKLYDNIFVPAISAVSLPEGGKLESRRTEIFFLATSSLRCSNIWNTRASRLPI